MLKKRYIGAALACALAMGAWSGAALANPVTVDGVTFNPQSQLNLNVQAINFRETSVSKVGDTVTGYGQIGSLNGTGESQFCPGCDLTFTFSYQVSSIDNSGTTPHIVFDNGSINLYVQGDNTFNVENPASVDTSNLWLALTGHDSQGLYSGFGSTVGQLFSTILGAGTVSAPGNGSNGYGLLDATGGPAQQYADFNNLPDGMTPGGMADVSLDSSFQFDNANICDGSICYPISGEGQIIGKPTPVSVPEPGELGLLGLGLVGLGFFIQRRRKESARRQ